MAGGGVRATHWRMVRVVLAVALGVVLIAGAWASPGGSDDTCPPPRCQDHQVPVPPGVAVPDSRVRVILPAGYDQQVCARYPVVYLLHGVGDTYRSWTENTDVVAATAGLPMIFVMPDGGRGGEAGWYSDWKDGSRQWETFHTDVLVDWVDATFRTRGDGHRGVVGLSMGGFGAMKYAARHPGLYRVAASFSGANDTRYVAPASGVAFAELSDAFGTPDERVWGDQVADEATWKAHNPTDLAAQLAGTQLFVATGTGTPGGPAGDNPNKAPNYGVEAFILQLNTSFRAALTRAGVPFTDDSYFGGYHDWPYWQREFHRSLVFVSSAIGGQVGCEGVGPTGGGGGGGGTPPGGTGGGQPGGPTDPNAPADPNAPGGPAGGGDGGGSPDGDTTGRTGAGSPRVLGSVQERPGGDGTLGGAGASLSALDGDGSDADGNGGDGSIEIDEGTTGRSIARSSGGGEGRSRLPASLISPDDVSADGRLLAENAALSLALIMLLTFPAELFNKTVEENYEEIKGWFVPVRRFGRRLRAFADPLARLVGKVSFRRIFTYTPIAMLLFAGVTASLYGLIDPTLNLGGDSFALVLGLLVAVVAVTTIYELSAAHLVRRRHGITGRFRLFPGAMVAAIACVAVSRMVDFAPGYLFGLVAGFDFQGRLREEDEGRALARGARNMLIAAFTAWMLWAPVDHLVEQGNDGFGMLVLDALLAATFVAGLEGAMFGMLPLRFLDGEKVLRYSQLAWLALFGTGLFGFVHILLHPRTGYIPTSGAVSVFTVLGFFAAFAAFSLAFWGYFRLREEADDEDDDEDGVDGPGGRARVLEPA